MAAGATNQHLGCCISRIHHVSATALACIKVRSQIDHPQNITGASWVTMRQLDMILNTIAEASCPEPLCFPGLQAGMARAARAAGMARAARAARKQFED